MYIYIYIHIYTQTHTHTHTYIYIYSYIITYISFQLVKLTPIRQLDFHFQCKTLFTIMIHIDTFMEKCNSSGQL